MRSTNVTGRVGTCHYHPGLDGVRGVAILLVMIHHLMIMQPNNQLESLAFAVANTGWIGVDLFFVLSGYLISSILLDTKGERGFVGRFWIRRALRILPLYYACVTFTLVVLPSISPGKAAALGQITGDEWFYWTLLSNFGIANTGAFRHGILDVSWSLAIEQQFYIVWPFVILAMNRKLLIMTIVAIFLASGVCRIFLLFDGVSPIALYVLTATRLEPIAAGAALAILLRSDVDLQRYCRVAYIAFAVSVLALAAICTWRGGFHYNDPVVSGLGLVFIAIASSALVLRIAIHPAIPSRIAGIFESQALTELGKYSYAMYLLHIPIRTAIRGAVIPPGLWKTFPGGALSAQAIFYAVSIALTFAVAWASFHYFEVHFLNLKRYFRGESEKQRVLVGTGGRPVSVQRQGAHQR